MLCFLQEKQGEGLFVGDRVPGCLALFLHSGHQFLQPQDIPGGVRETQVLQKGAPVRYAVRLPLLQHSPHGQTGRETFF